MHLISHEAFPGPNSCILATQSSSANPSPLASSPTAVYLLGLTEDESGLTLNPKSPRLESRWYTWHIPPNIILLTLGVLVSCELTMTVRLWLTVKMLDHVFAWRTRKH